MNKNQRKEIHKQIAEKELVDFRKNLPIDENIFSKLFDYLDVELGKNDCNHTAILTRRFLDKKEVSNSTDVFQWLADNGGFCDCEILANVEQLFEYLNPLQSKSFTQNKTKKQKLTSLKLDIGISIDKIPKPWTLIEIISENKSNYCFQIGKSNNCIVNLITDSPSAQFDNDKFCIDLWIKETELYYNIEDLMVERHEFENYLILVVKTKNWTPVKIWFIRKGVNKWFLKMTTELSRYKGDIKELERLINNIQID